MRKGLSKTVKRALQAERCARAAVARAGWPTASTPSSAARPSPEFDHPPLQSLTSSPGFAHVYPKGDQAPNRCVLDLRQPIKVQGVRQWRTLRQTLHRQHRRKTDVAPKVYFPLLIMVFFTLPAVVLRENTEGGPNDGQIGKGKTRRDNSDKDGPKNAFDLMMSGHPKTQAPQKSKTLEKLEKQVLNTVALICVVHARGNGRSG